MNLKSHLAGALAGIAVTAAAATAASAEAWPDLPVGIKNGIAARVGDRLIVGLGSAGNGLYALDLNDRSLGWTTLDAFIGPETSGAAAAVSGESIFVFSGSGKASADDASPVIFDTVYRYDAGTDAWEKLDTTTPVGLLGASALPLPDGRIALVGGYNKELFDAISPMSPPRTKTQSPRNGLRSSRTTWACARKTNQWNDRVLVFDPASASWGDLGETPSLPNTGSAVVETEPGVFTVINGEIKPGLRTADVKQVAFGAEGATWEELADLPPPAGEPVQEGVAGAYAGLSNGVTLAAGGANFQGARANADAGRWFAHDGLSKRWVDEVFALSDGNWTEIGALGEGLAYGAAFTLDEGLLLVGGEDGTGTARADVFLLDWDGQTLERVD